MKMLFTIGYEGTDIERFVRTLEIAGVKQLADVRAVAGSRKPGFSKTRLRERLESSGITYRHFIDLGDPKPGREAARAGKIALFEKIFGEHMRSDRAAKALIDLNNFAASAPTCLLCFERNPKFCHRTIVANASSRALAFGVLNLYADDPERYVRFSAKLPSGNIGQSAAAA